MAEETPVNPQITDEIKESPEKSGSGAGDAEEDFHDPTTAAPAQFWVGSKR